MLGSVACLRVMSAQFLCWGNYGNRSSTNWRAVSTVTAAGSRAFQNGNRADAVWSSELRSSVSGRVSEGQRWNELRVRLGCSPRQVHDNPAFHGLCVTLARLYKRLSRGATSDETHRLTFSALPHKAPELRKHSSTVSKAARH